MVAAVAVTSEAEVAEEAAITVIADPDTAAADPEAPALLPDVMIAEDPPEVAAAPEHERHDQESSVQSCKIDKGVLLRTHTAQGADVIQSHKDRDGPPVCCTLTAVKMRLTT